MSQSPTVYSINHFLPGKSKYSWNKSPLIRNRGTWDKHLKSIHNYCKSQAVMYDNTNHHGGTIIKKANNCNSWDCPECRKKKASILKSRIETGTAKQSWRLLTLTFDPKITSLPDSLSTCSHSWDLFVKRLKRQFPNIAWIKVLEFQKNGYPHFHMMVNKFIYKPWLKSAWIECGGGEIVDIKIIKSKNVARYVSGYLSHKDNKHHERDYQFFYYALRRFAFSRNFCIRPWHKTTLVFTRGIDFDCIGDYWNNVINLLYKDGGFFAVTKKNEIKYINLHSNSMKFLEC